MNGYTWPKMVGGTIHKVNRARVGLTFHDLNRTSQSFILKWPLKLTCVITFEYDINCARV